MTACVDRWKLLNQWCSAIELVKIDPTQQNRLRSAKLAYFNHRKNCQICREAAQETLEMARNANHPEFTEDL